MQAIEHSRERRRRPLRVVTAGVVVAALAATAGPALASTGGSAAPARAARDTAATTVRVSSFNVLGYNHTAPGGDRKGWADGNQRMVWATQLITRNALQIVGLQEFQVPQYKKFVSLLGDTYSVWPGVSMGGVPVQNSIAWTKASWTPVLEKTIPIPYFGGKPIDMPYVLLRNTSTGQQVWVYNSHNPANTAGPAQKWRDQAVNDEIGLVNSLEKQYPGVPIIDLGDKNDTDLYLCPMMRGTDLHAANGGSIAADGTCVMPAPTVVDWITGNPLVTFSGYTSLHGALVRKTTDHHLVFADATLRSAATAAPREHVVAINIQGLRGPALASPAKTPMPNLERMIREGASTFEARSDYETVYATQNNISMLTSRPTARKYGGTGLAVHPRGTVQQAAGSYVSSVFDVVHDAGLRTGFWTTNPVLARTVTSTWRSAGAPDRVGADNGRTKISAAGATSTDRAAMTALITDLQTHGTSFAYADLTAADRIARVEGFHSARYRAALTALDGYLGQLLGAIAASPALAGHTTVIVTSDHGAVKDRYLTATEPAAYRVPFVAWGAGVARGRDLYALNPAFADPGTARPSYAAARQPIRVSYLANLVTKLLALPHVPSSRMDAARKLRVGTGG